MRAIRFVAALILLATFAKAESPEIFPLGQVIPKVVCAANTSQSYALYLPTSYRKEKKFPIVFIFEPAARGPLPVKIMSDAAEKFGYILVASNNSRNGPFPPELEAAKAMWQDATSRFHVDPQRIYMAGFSGGARAAITFAAACKGCIAGVATSGAGFPPGLEPKKSKYFAMFTAIGMQDFNFPEILGLEPKLQEAGFDFHVRRFDGIHQWAPPEVWLEAFEWFDLQAMKSGSLPRNAAFIADAYQRALANAAALIKDHHAFDAYREYRQIAADFNGLLDPAEAIQRSTDLAKLKEVKDAGKQERRDADLQANLTNDISAKINELARNSSEEQSLMRDLHELFDDLRHRANNDKNASQIVAQRALTQEVVHAIETGGHFMDQKDYQMALIMFEVVVANSKQAPGAHLQRARAYAALGEKKQAIEELHLALKDGLAGPATLEQPEFASLQSDPEFKSILESVPPPKQ